MKANKPESKLVFTSEPSKGYIEKCQKNGAFIHTPTWQKVLKAGFGVKSLYGWDNQNHMGMALSIFKAAIFRVGYIGFPAGGTITNRSIDDELIQCLKEARYDLPLHTIRITSSPFYDQIKIPENTEQTWETTITDLSSWSLNKISKNIQRDVRKADRHLKINKAQTSNDADEMHKLYKKTIQRHNGNLRYSKSYFRALVNLSKQSEKIKCLIALFQNEVAGFIVIINNGLTANYLHGAIDFNLKMYRASDLLIATAIQWAQEKHMSSFNFMASPLEQSSLVKYKERWGAQTLRQHTFNVSVSPIGGNLFNASIKSYKLLQKWKKR